MGIWPQKSLQVIREQMVDCSTLKIWLMVKLTQISVYGVVERVPVPAGDSPGPYTPKTSFYAELPVYVAFEQRKTG